MNKIKRKEEYDEEGNVSDWTVPCVTEIPIMARILTVCDSYDAMTADRPYRERRTKEESVVELKMYAGTQFVQSGQNHPGLRCLYQNWRAVLYGKDFF